VGFSTGATSRPDPAGEGYQNLGRFTEAEIAAPAHHARQPRMYAARGF